MRETVSNLAQVRVVSPDGGFRVLCDIGCAEKYIVATGARDTGEELVVVPMRVAVTCAHCAWCGECVAVPVWCVVHDTEDEMTCPDFAPLASLRAEKAVERLRARAGGDLSPRAFDYLEKAANAFRDAGVDGTADLLFARVWDSHVDWL